MSIYERQKEKQSQERIFRVRKNRLETLIDRCSICGSVEDIKVYLGDDDIIYHYCVEHEQDVIDLSRLPFNRDSVPIGKNFWV